MIEQHFEEYRSHLQAVAYRMLGSIADAEDAVQETWVRFRRSDTDAIENLGGWLTTTASRVCLDMLRARQARHEQSIETWLPASTVRPDESLEPEQEAMLAEAVGMALTVLLETLQPIERLAFVLHDMFRLPFDQIATIVERSPAAARQLASRARRRVRDVAPVPVAVPVPGQRRVTQHNGATAFLAAARGGDVAGLLTFLDPTSTAASRLTVGREVNPVRVLALRQKGGS